MAAQGGGVATVLTSGRRCSRRRLGVVGVPGGARVPCPGSRLLPRPARRGGGAPASSPNRCKRGGGERENPKRGWVAWRPCHAVPVLLNRSRGPLEEEKPPLPLAVRRSRAGGARGRRLGAPRMLGGGADGSLAFPAV
jgi:hypothetical protein